MPLPPTPSEPVCRSLRRFAGVALLACGAAVRLAAADTDWTPTVWNGEKALLSIHEGGQAIVSLERGRLVHFGRAAGGVNLLFATATRDDPAGWGGHRLWLGPQSKWAKIWPPPDAWEHSGPESFTIDDNGLHLVMRDAGDGWPRLTRTYRWSGHRLVCGAELRGGTRLAQVIQIVQVPMTTRVSLTAKPEAGAPRGYVRLPAGPVTRLTTTFEPPPHVSRNGDALTLHYTGEAEKLGFRPQPLTALYGDQPLLTVYRGAPSGRVVAEADQGFSTQVFLGSHEPFVELEQLSSYFAAGAAATFEIVIEGGEPAAAR